MAEMDEILSSHGLRKTAFRVELLSLFSQTKSSLSIEDIKSKVGSTNDKVTVYRALDAFEKSGLIHKVPDKLNVTRYALCHTNCSDEGHVHNHAHFICTSCEETFCIDELDVPKIQSPAGYHISKSSLTLEGECPNCVES
jgi:Fur family transcriptional regulator, ferric uptake regulator